jgi:hypothetical protein
MRGWGPCTRLGIRRRMLETPPGRHDGLSSDADHSTSKRLRSRHAAPRLILVVMVTFTLFPGMAPVLAQTSTSVPIQTDHIPEGRIAGINIALTSAVAVTRGVLTGRVRNGRDVARHAIAGAASGYGFYQAKRMIGQENELQGLLLAYTAASVLRNVGEGNHPIGVLCAGPGPVDLCLRTGLDPALTPGVRLEVNAMAVASASVFTAMGMAPQMRHGTLHFRAQRGLGTEGNFVRTGFAIGRMIVLSNSAHDDTWQHELIHLVQSLQIGSVTPHLTARSLLHRVGGGDPRERPYAVRTWDVQVDWLLLTVAAANSLIPYEHQWNEIEAYRLTRGLSGDGYGERPVLFDR